MKSFLRLIVFVVFCQLIGLAGAILTTPSVNNWYITLNKASFNPPAWVFSPAWTTLYLLMGVSLFLVWRDGLRSKKVKIAVGFFLGQLFLNFLWSVVFFGLHSPLFAFLEITVLWIVILLTIIKFFEISKPAAYLLIPYLLWVGFASVLNFYVVILN
ncbi:MAG: TspO/MBR family protein [Candidatus Levyibacteriota bacterium]